MTFEYNPFAFLPNGEIIGDGLVNIKSIFYPPLVLNSMISLQISALGVMTYKNTNISAINIYSLYNNLIDLKDNIINNKINFFMNNITISGGGKIKILEKSNLIIQGGGICYNNCTINVTKNSKLTFEYNPFAFLPNGEIIGDGLVNIKSIFYPPLVLNSMISLQISALGVMTYKNTNISAINIYSLYNNLFNLKDNIINNKINFFMNNITISGGGKIEMLNNVNLNINNVILKNGIISVDNNGTLFISNSLNLLSGMIDGNGVLNIKKNGFLNFLPIDSTSSIISKINIMNYGNIYAYEKTINFIKYSKINNYGNIQFYGFQNWENNQILSSFEDSFPINWENAPKGSIYENSNLIKCAAKCVNNQIISSTIGKAQILIENMIPCKSYLYNKKTKICQINSQFVSTSIYTPNVTYTWDVYNKNNQWLKAPKIINHKNATFLANPKQPSLLSENIINIDVDFQNYGNIKIAPKITLFSDYEFIQYQSGISQIFGNFKTRKSSINGLIVGNGSIYFLNTNNTIITNDTFRSDFNFENHNFETSIISENLKVKIYSLINVNKNCRILSFKEILIDTG